MNKTFFIAPGIAVLVLVFGYMATIALKTPDCVFPDSPETKAPDWICTSSIDGLGIIAMGYAEKSKAGYAFMKQMAAADARTTLARLSPGQNAKFTREASVPITITDKDLMQTRIVKSVTSPAGGLYVLVEFVPD